MKTPAYNRSCTVLDFSQFKRNQQVQMLSFHKNQWEMYLGSAMVHKKNPGNPCSCQFATLLQENSLWNTTGDKKKAVFAIICPFQSVI